MAIRGILFDKDGTIIDYARTWVPLNREAADFAAGGDVALADELLLAHGQDPVTDAVEAGSVLAAGSIADIADAFAVHLGKRAPADLSESLEKLYTAGGARRAVLIDGVDGTLAELKRRGLRLGIATNDSLAGLKASLERTGTLGLFDFTAGYDSGHGTKPGAGMALAFCNAMRLDPGKTAMVGDAVHDLAMGRAARMGLAIGVLSGTSAAADLAPYADMVLPTINDLLPLPQFQRRRWWQLFS